MAAPRQPDAVPLLALARALVLRRAAALSYRDAGPRSRERRGEVVALGWRGDAWLAAVSWQRGSAFRLCPVDRIVRCRVLPVGADGRPPPGFDPCFFSRAGFLEPGAEGPTRATVELSAPLDELAAAFFPGAPLERGSGRALCHVLASDLGALSGLVSSLGPGARLLGA